MNTKITTLSALTLVSLLITLASGRAQATTTEIFPDGATDYQQFMLSHPDVKVISVTAAKNSQGEIIHIEDGDQLVVRRTTRSGLKVVYED